MRRFYGGRSFLSRGPETSTLSVTASYNIFSFMRQKVSRSVGRLQEVVVYVSFLFLRSQAVKLINWKKIGGFRIGGHLYKAVTYNFVMHIFKGSPYFLVSSGIEICRSIYFDICKNNKLVHINK